jgi:hypothetical protein
MTQNALTSVLLLAVSFFFLEFVIGPAWAVPMDVGGPVQRQCDGHYEHGGRIGSVPDRDRVRRLLSDRGSWIAPFFVSAGVMLIGALIWTFLIDPERSVV